MATNYNTKTFVRSLFGEEEPEFAVDRMLTAPRFNESPLPSTTGLTNQEEILPHPLTAYPDTFGDVSGSLSAPSSASRPGADPMFASLNKPMFGNGSMNIGTFAQLAGMAAQAIGPQTEGGRLGGMLANYAGRTMHEGRAYAERDTQRREAMAEKKREFDERQKDRRIQYGLSFAGNKSFSKADRLRQFNAIAKDIGLPTLDKLGDDHGPTIKAIGDIYKDQTIPAAQKRQLALNRMVEDAVESGDMEPKAAVDLLFPQQTLGGLQGMDEKGNPYFLDTQGRKVEGITPYRKTDVKYFNRGNMADVYVDGKYQQTVSRGSLTPPKGNEPKPVTDEDRKRLMAAIAKATNSGKKSPSETDKLLIGQMAERQGYEFKDTSEPGRDWPVIGRIKSKPRYGLVPKQRAGQTPPPGYRDSGRTDMSGRQVWISADGKTAWVAD